MPAAAAPTRANTIHSARLLPGCGAGAAATRDDLSFAGDPAAGDAAAGDAVPGDAGAGEELRCVAAGDDAVR